MAAESNTQTFGHEAGINQRANSNLNLTKEQTEQLYKLLTPTNPGNSCLAQKSTSILPFGGLSEREEQWIIDSGATNHMTGGEKLFATYNPSPGNHNVKIADSTLLVIAGVCTINLGPNLILKSVLHIPQLSCNLISVS